MGFFRRRKDIQEPHTDSFMSCKEFLAIRAKDIQVISTALKAKKETNEKIASLELYLLLADMRKKYEDLKTTDDVERLRELTIFSISANMDIVATGHLAASLVETYQLRSLLEMYENRKGILDIDAIKDAALDNDFHQVGTLLAQEHSQRLKILLAEINAVKAEIEANC